MKQDREAIESLMRRMASQAGCTCRSVDIEMPELSAGELAYAYIYHEEGCPLTRDQPEEAA